MRAQRIRRLDGQGRASNIELFFDLVFVFAVTQLSHLIVAHTSWQTAIYAAVLLAMVWQTWVYTTWAITYLNPEHGAVRAMLLGYMLGSLLLAAAIPGAFHARGTTVAVAYVAMHVSQPLFMIAALRGDPLRMTFVRIAPWSCATSAIVLVGAAEHGHVRAGLWALSVAIDLVAAAYGFWVPRLGRSATSDWTISGGHFAERCQAFVLIALGESIVVIGTLLSGRHVSATVASAFAVAFLGSVGFWWIYFDRSATDSARRIEESDDPGRIARDAFHWVHPMIIAGVIVAAAGDDKVMARPAAHGVMSTAWLVLGGAALYLAGHALFKLVVWRRLSWQRVGGVVVLGLLFLLAPHVSALVIAGCALAVIVAVAVADRTRLSWLRRA
jgi:low temperature requirement protein LtrA